jgi:hypothetical protein
METLSLNSIQEGDALKDVRSSIAGGRALEASRYALLQRLTPAIRHQVAGTFQPVMMLASMMQKLAQTPNADLEKIGAHCASLSSFSRSGASSSLECFSWFAATERVDINVHEGIKECLGLVATELALREFTVINNSQLCDQVWPREAMRNVFMAALLAVADAAASPAELVISSVPGAESLALMLSVHSANAAIACEPVPIYRKIEWLDVELLAEAEGVSVERTADGVRLSFIAGMVEA